MKVNDNNAASATKHSFSRFALRSLNGRIWLAYFLSAGSCANGSRFSYSISIFSLHSHSREQIVLPDITEDRATAVRLFRMLVRGRVTPYAADEVMESLLEETHA